MPLVSIGLPLVNEPLEDVEFAIQSIFGQTVQAWELFIFCDGSSDSHYERFQAIDDARVTVLRNESPRGIANSLNRLAQIANGEYIAILASDDAWPLDRLEVQLAHLRGDPALDVSAGQMVIIDEAGAVVGGQSPARLPREASGWVSGTPVSHATAMASKGWFLSHPYDESLLRAQDRAFWIASHQDSRIEIMDEVLYYYRVPMLPNYRKYARSCGFARAVIWKYGPLVCSRPEVVRIYLEAWVKQGIVAVAYAMGLYPKVYQRRLVEIPSEEMNHHSRMLQDIAAVSVPGWESKGA